jgi:hypothetical protein
MPVHPLIVEREVGLLAATAKTANEAEAASAALLTTISTLISMADAKLEQFRDDPDRVASFHKWRGIAQSWTQFAAAAANSHRVTTARADLCNRLLAAGPPQ